MPYFIMLTTLTGEGRKTLMKNPGRILEVNREVEEMGAKILAQYAIIGQWDFINILQAPSNEVIARVAAQLGARGTLKGEFVVVVEGATRRRRIAARG